MIIQERLKAIRKSLNMNQTEFAERLQMKQNSWSQIENGKNPLLDRHVKSLCKEFNVNEQWLRGGEGEMFSDASASLLDELAEHYHLSALEMRIMSMYLSLPAKQREAIMDFVRRINTQPEEEEQPVPFAAYEGIDPIQAEIDRLKQQKPPDL